MTAVHGVPEQATTDAQRRAAAPDRSAWAAASAGTGKTKVLVDRVLRLLLAGAPPQRLLCLTFTKAAAKQMNNRLTEVLRDWTTLPRESVAASLETLSGQVPDDQQMTRARRLFAQVLDAPGGLRIDTIHAFCQSLLRRFPIEARLPPNFQVLDERSAAELLQTCREAMLAEARGETGGELAEALAAITARTGETGFEDLIAELTRERGRLRRLIPSGPNLRRSLRQALRRLYGRLQLDPADTEESLTAAACDDARFAVQELRRAADALIKGSVTDRRRGEALAAWLSDPATRAAGFQIYCRAYFKAEGGRLQKLVTKETLKFAPGVDDVLATEAARLERVIEQCNAAHNAAGTAALLRLAAELEARYDAAKTARAVLDYDDLILKTSELLTRPGIAPWVLYKIDGGLDHVLIDEAQDTNPEQWQVIGALAGEFFSGEGARSGDRTVFAVGDVKQSIYSFQRADPRAFVAMRNHFAEQAGAAGRHWTNEELIESFRSTAAVLEAVDAVFGREEARRGVALDGAPIRHCTVRRGDGGLVELWPPVIPREREALLPWALPAERLEEDSPPARLARLIAVRIAEWRRAERLESKGRLVQAHDIMILVRRRNALVDLIVRELKKAGVPVAGVDRMVLADQLAVMDMVVLGRFLLLPDDDLTLATVLKGPLFGFTEERLFELAYGRGDVSLWSELRRRAGENGDFQRADTELSELMARVDYVRPYDLFAEVLGQRGGRRRIVARLGIEANDPLDEFLAAALTFERGHAPALETFLHWLEAGREEVKRDLEVLARDEVRVMTVHGAKGLQAPIVILPDTLQLPRHGARLLWHEGIAGDPDMPLWSSDSRRDDALSRSARQAFREAQQAEYRRLLYVAMTRAEDRLYVCGYEQNQEPSEGCWYRLVKAGLAGAKGVEAFEMGEPPGTAFRLTSPQRHAVKPSRLETLKVPDVTLPPWWNRPPPDEPDPPRPLVPSRPEGEEPPVRGPFDDDGSERRYRRGQIIHRLLQTLPDLPADQREAAAARFLARPVHRLDERSQSEIRREALAVLSHPDWAPLFAEGSVAEAPIVGRVGNRILSGQIDRLRVTEDQVLIVDYKTNRPPPLKTEGTPTIYLRQMAAYRAALSALYPGRPVRCALLWTDGPRLMELPESLLDPLAP
jgi:ATP-dependent helicase/nuclease subunit A